MPIATNFARQAAREGFELDNDIFTAFERFEVVEIEATDGTALGIEVDVTDHEAVTSMVARVVEDLGSVRCPGRECGRRSRSADGYQAQHPRPGALTASRGDESVRL
jgi:NAD(P)-dependent dehydrogenase (short-subunit alcohol dehydrogenase family)